MLLYPISTGQVYHLSAWHGWVVVLALAPAPFCLVDRTRWNPRMRRLEIYVGHEMCESSKEKFPDGQSNATWYTRHRLEEPRCGNSVVCIANACTVRPAYMVYGYMVLSFIWSIFCWSQSASAILVYNPVVWSARLYDQISVDKIGKKRLLFNGLKRGATFEAWKHTEMNFPNRHPLQFQGETVANGKGIGGAPSRGIDLQSQRPDCRG